MSNDPKDDDFLCPFRPPFDAAQLPGDITAISRAEIHELARLHPNVDLVKYSNSEDSDSKA